MTEITGVYEVAIRVRELERAESFYREVLGLAEGLRDEERRWLFLRAGGSAGMVVLQEDPGPWPAQHLAFRADAEALGAATERLRARGVEVEGPVVHDWIPAVSIYFRDPDGHELELCAPDAGASESP